MRMPTEPLRMSMYIGSMCIPGSLQNSNPKSEPENCVQHDQLKIDKTVKECGMFLTVSCLQATIPSVLVGM